MNTGTIKFYNSSKGFGFISPDAGDKEVFVPPATAQASGIKKLLPGLRVSFEIEPDPRGVKAVSLRAMENAASAEVSAKPSQLTLYHAEPSHAFECVCDALDDLGHAYTLIDYIAAPPTPEVLKGWSLELSGSGANLVRRADPLFYALQLDDRFISESEYWLSVSQHPAVLNGPFLMVEGRIGACKSEDDVHRLLSKRDPSIPSKRKGISARLVQMMQGAPVAPVLPAAIGMDNESELLDPEANGAPASSATPIGHGQAMIRHLNDGEVAPVIVEEVMRSASIVPEFTALPAIKKAIVLPKVRAKKPLQS